MTTTDFETLDQLARLIDRSGIDITANYHDWVAICFACASVGEAGRQPFHLISRHNPGYNAEECDRKFSNCLRSTRQHVTVGTLIEHARRHGIELPKPACAAPATQANARRGRPKSASTRANQFEAAKTFLKQQADFRRNALTQRVEYCWLHGRNRGKWKDYDDKAAHTFYVRVREANVTVSQNDLGAIIDNDDFLTTYHPFVEWVSSLPEWDGQHDYIADLFGVLRFPTDADRLFCLPYLKKWFIAMVALATDHERNNQLMPVLTGDAHAGKSYFCRHLLPPELRRYIHEINPGTDMNRDELIATSESTLIVFDEFTLTRHNSNILKAIISSEGTTLRPPYGHHSIYLHRRASFIGSCNVERFIADADGDRRYLSVPVVGTRHFTDADLPLAEAYAQAWAIIGQGDATAWTTTQADSQLITDRNQRFLRLDFCEEFIKLCYRRPLPDEKGGVMLSVAQVMHEISCLQHSHEITPVNVGRALKRLGFERSHTASGNCYYVKRIEAAERREHSEAEGAKMHEKMRTPKNEGGVV